MTNQRSSGRSVAGAESGRIGESPALPEGQAVPALQWLPFGKLSFAGMS
jgi:hypothetical protein